MMNTTTLPIQNLGAAPQYANAAASQGPDAGEFGAALSREIAQRQEAEAPAPAPQPQQAAQKPQADEPAEPAKAAAQDQAKAAPAKPDGATKSADAGKAKDDDDKDEHPATAQVADMLALVASLNLPGQAGAVAAGKQALAAGGRGKLETTQLGAAQGTGKDGALGKAYDALGQLKNPAAATLGAQLGADQKASAKGGFDLHAATEALSAKLKVQPENAQLTAQERAALEAAVAKDATPVATALAQAANLQPAQVAQAAADAIPARVGSAGWDQQLGQKIVWMVAGEEQSASLTLNPPDLGPLQVVLNVSNDQASVAFSSNQLEVRQALENALPRLREMMSESGIALGNATVNAGMPDQRQAQGDGQSRPGGGGSQGFGGGNAAVAETAIRPAARVVPLGDSGMVDTFA